MSPVPEMVIVCVDSLYVYVALLPHEPLMSALAMKGKSINRTDKNVLFIMKSFVAS
jgi:hypothetical protein